MVVRFASGCLPAGFWKYLCFQMLLFVLIVFFDSMSEKCVAGGRVVVVVLPSSCSFLLMVDEVINISMESMQPCTVN